MNKLKILIVEGDEVQIRKFVNYLDDNKNIEIKYLTIDTYKKKTITNLLHNLGISSNINGYKYIIKAIELLIKNDEKNISKLYKNIAASYNTKVSNIESSIRYAIDRSWNRGNIELINNIFGYSIDISKVKPTNTEYLTSIKDIIINDNYRINKFDK